MHYNLLTALKMQTLDHTLPFGVRRALTERNIAARAIRALPAPTPAPNSYLSFTALDGGLSAEQPSQPMTYRSD